MYEYLFLCEEREILLVMPEFIAFIASILLELALLQGKAAPLVGMVASVLVTLATLVM